jgi:hypothetical protein
MGNRISFGNNASWPNAYHNVSAIFLPFKDNGNMAAQLYPSSFFTADITALGNMDASLVGDSTVTANGNMAANIRSDLVGESTFNVTPSAIGNMSASINAGATPSAFDIAQEVWGSIAAQNNVNNTMGQKLNNAGDPWQAVIESGLTAADVLKLILAVQTGESTVVALGGGAATVTFKSVDGATNRVQATMAGSERTGVTLIP